jgi:hypothetical protein
MEDKDRGAALAKTMSEIKVVQYIEGGSSGIKTTAPDDIGSVYGRGDLMAIELKDLVGNEVAIMQLINNHNHQARKCADAERRLSEKEGEIEFLKTSPFIALVMLPVGAVGAVIGSVGVNLLTSEKPPLYASALTYIGAGLVLLSGVANVLYPFARKIFNRKPR